MYSYDKKKEKKTFDHIYLFFDFLNLFIVNETGVEEVMADSKASKVVVKGKNADPLKVCERIQKKSGRKVELISPLPKPPEEIKKDEKKEELPKEEKKDEVNIYYCLIDRKIIFV